MTYKKTDKDDGDINVGDIDNGIDLDELNDSLEEQSSSSNQKRKKNIFGFFKKDESIKKSTKSNYGNSIVPGEDRAFFELFSIHASTAKRQNRITMVSLCIAIIALVSNGVNGGTKFVPVLVAQSDIGKLTPLGAVKTGALKVNEEVIIGQIYDYLDDLRSVNQDIKLENRRKKQLQLMTSPDDWKKIKDLFYQQVNDAGQDIISIEITQIMPIRSSSKNAWRVQWVETFSNSNVTKRFEAMFNTSIIPLDTNNPELIALNFSGIQISNFTMSQVFDGTQQKQVSDNQQSDSPF